MFIELFYLKYRFSSHVHVVHDVILSMRMLLCKTLKFFFHLQEHGISDI
jgi:hypothetical protein